MLHQELFQIAARYGKQFKCSPPSPEISSQSPVKVQAKLSPQLRYHAKMQVARAHLFEPAEMGLGLNDILSHVSHEVSTESAEVTLSICACHPWSEQWWKHFVLLLWDLQPLL